MDWNDRAVAADSNKVLTVAESDICLAVLRVSKIIPTPKAIAAWEYNAQSGRFFGASEILHTMQVERVSRDEKLIGSLWLMTAKFMTREGNSWLD